MSMADLPTFAPALMFLICFGVTVAMQLSFFVIAFTCQFDKVTDLAGTLNFFTLAILTLVVQNVYSTRAIVTTCLVGIWALRLGGYLFQRVIKRGKDERFDAMRSQCLPFFGFWVFQIFWVFVVSLPVILGNSSHEPPTSSFADSREIAGVIVWAIGFLMEWMADASKDAFYHDTSNKGKLLCTGVWKYSRHPNYFGEMLCWIGLTVLNLPSFEVADQEWFYVSLLSPLFTFFLLMFVSGVPMAEDRYDERFGLEPQYLEYKRSTSPLVPCPPVLYRNLPLWIKQLVFLELPMYSRKLRELQGNRTLATDYRTMP